MALSFGGLQSNMGPFKPVSLKGNANVHGVPMFVDKLPLTIGGIAGDNIPFGRVVSIKTDAKRTFVPGIPTGAYAVGISMLDPSILSLDPGQIDTKSKTHYYYAGRPMTAITFGIMDVLEYDTAQSAPALGASVWARNSDGVLAFAAGDAKAADMTGYTKLNAYVYEVLDPNGAKVFFGLPCPGIVAEQTKETLNKVATPTVSPAAGAIDAGTQVSLSTTTTGAKILYTTDGTTPDMSSTEYTTPITVTAAVTIKAIAIADGYDPSEVLSAAYTIK